MVVAEVGPRCRCGCVLHLAPAARLLAGSAKACSGRSLWLLQVTAFYCIQGVKPFSYPKLSYHRFYPRVDVTKLEYIYNGYLMLLVFDFTSEIKTAKRHHGPRTTVYAKPTGTQDEFEK